MANLASMTTDELLGENERLMGEMAKATAPIRAQQIAVQQEINRRMAEAKMEDALAGLTPENRAAVLASLTEGSTDG